FSFRIFESSARRRRRRRSNTRAEWLFLPVSRLLITIYQSA
ncbi:hypothetical protein T05_13145, partial [Trichinella murrelli]